MVCGSLFLFSIFFFLFKSVSHGLRLFVCLFVVITKAPELLEALNLFVGTFENRIGTPNFFSEITVSTDSFRRVVLCVTSHESLEESLLSYTSSFTVSRDNGDSEMQTTLKKLPPYLIFQLEVMIFSFFQKLPLLFLNCLFVCLFVCLFFVLFFVYLLQREPPSTPEQRSHHFKETKTKINETEKEKERKRRKKFIPSSPFVILLT
jgi:hypothetical protein